MKPNWGVLTSFIKQYYNEATGVPPRLRYRPIPSKSRQPTQRPRSLDGSCHVPRATGRDLSYFAAQKPRRKPSNKTVWCWLNDEQKTTSSRLQLQNSEAARTASPDERYDISTTTGTNNVASMVVSRTAAPKSDYRRFKIVRSRARTISACRARGYPPPLSNEPGTYRRGRPNAREGKSKKISRKRPRQPPKNMKKGLRQTPRSPVVCVRPSWVWAEQTPKNGKSGAKTQL